MRQDTSIDGCCALDGLPDHLDSLEWMKGTPMPHPSPDKELILDLSPASGDYRGDIIDGFLTLYSDELREALAQLGVDNIEYYPVVLRDQNSNTLEDGYSLANIIGLLDCVDMKRSRVRWWPSGMGFDFQKMVIDERKTNGMKLFRLHDDPTKVIINEELKRALVDDTDMLAGVTVLDTEEYADF
jgi:hypothetical protein